MPEPPRIPLAIVMPRFAPGGTERQMGELIRRLDRSRWAVHIACFDQSGAWFDRVRCVAASVATFPVTSFRRADVWRHAAAFGRWCRQERIAIVHTSELYSNIFALPAAAIAGVPVRIANRREINPDKTAAQIGMQRVAYAFADMVVANSEAAAERLRSERVPARKIAVVPNGLDISAFVERKPLPREFKTIVVVANLRPEKGHDLLIDAVPEILRRFPTVRFEIVGDGPLREALVARTTARGVSHAVAFRGYQEDVASQLARADVFVLPSRSEAAPNALLEAMAAGLPVVASAVGGNLEVVDDGRTGLLVSPEAAPLASAICRLLDDQTLAASLGHRARTAVASRYSFDRMVSRFETIYRSALARHGFGAAAQLAAT